MPISSKDLHDALRTIRDPDTGRDVVTLGVVREAVVDATGVLISMQVQASQEVLTELRNQIVAAVGSIATSRGETAPPIRVEFAAPYQTPNAAARERAAAGPSPLPGVRHVIAVGAGKGGVGKSTVAALLAIGLARRGAAVGLLDGDIYGPSMPTMLGLEDVPTTARGAMLQPF